MTRLKQRAETCVSDVRNEDDALLTEISQDFDQDEDIGPNINQQLADIIIKRWSAKLCEPKTKERWKIKSTRKLRQADCSSC